MPSRSGLLALMLLTSWLLVVLPCAGRAATLLVPTEYPTIQDAVTAASAGDSVSVAAGTYEEQVWITQNITVLGAGSDQTIVRSPLTLGHTFDVDHKAVVFVENADAVTLVDLGIDGADRATAAFVQVGIGFLDGGGVVTRCEIANLREAVMSDTQTGLGIYAYNAGGAPRTIAVDEVDIHHYQKSGAVFRGAALTVALDEATVTPGEISPAVQNGIEILTAASAIITGGSVTDHRYEEMVLAETSVGILVSLATSCDITGVSITGNQSGVYLHETAGTLEACSIVGWDDALAEHGVVVGTIDGRAQPPLGIAVPLPAVVVEGEDAEKGTRDPWTSFQMTGCTLTGYQQLATAGLVVNVVDQPDPVVVDLVECRFTAWDYGVQLWNTNSTVEATVHLGHLADNLSYGLFSDSLQPVDARNCWWQATDGPAGVGPGSGDAVSANVLFDPWLGGPVGLSIYPGNGGLINCYRSVTLTFHYVPGASAEPMRGFEIYVDTGSELDFSAADVTDSGELGAIGDHFFEALDEVDGSVSVTDVLLGPTPGLTAEADLFTITFHGADTGTATVGITAYDLRDLANQGIGVAGVYDASIEVDCLAPTAVDGIIAEPGHQQVVLTWNGSPSADLLEYEIWRGMWYDTTPGDSAYPEYNNLPGNTLPTRPPSRFSALLSDEWELAGVVPADSLSFVDTGDTTRGVYYYEVYARDIAFNFSQYAMENSGATNYWLGDFTWDGYVDNADMSFLGSTFTTAIGDADYKAQANVGPTDGSTSTDIPHPNNVVYFEDLTIAAVNFDMIGGGKLDDGSGHDHLPVPLAWEEIDAGVWSLLLREACPHLQALHLQAELPDDVVATVQPGQMLAALPDPFFLHPGTPRNLDICLAILGRNRGFGQAGEIVRITLSAMQHSGGEAAAFWQSLGLELDLVSNTLADLEYSLTQQNPDRPPSVAVLYQNVPNPFNPRTTIRFSLPRAQEIDLALFRLDGRLAVRLVEGLTPAGTHEVVWDGNDATGRPEASGMYMCRLVTETDTRVRKMILAR